MANSTTKTKDEKKAMMGILVAIAEYYQCSLSDTQLRLYYDDLQDLGANDLLKAFSTMRGTNQVFPGRFPLPAKIREYAQGINEAGMALQVMINIRRAIRKHGYLDPSGARELIGEIGWSVIEPYGWPALCAMDQDQMSWHMTQIQKAVQTLVAARERTIAHDRAHALPSRTKSRLKALMEGIGDERNRRPDDAKGEEIAIDTKAREEVD